MQPVDRQLTRDYLPERERLLIVYLGSDLIHTDCFSALDASSRSKFARIVSEKINTRFAFEKYSPDEVDELVMVEAVRVEEERTSAKEPRSGPPSYAAIEGDDKPVEEHGMYKLMPDGTIIQMCNFIILLTHDNQLSDDFVSERRFEGEIKLGGEASPFSIAFAVFADNQKFQAAVYGAVGPSAQFFCDMSQIRTAVSALSESEKVLRTTAHGWNDERTLYLTPTGVVDRDGFRPYRAGEVSVDLGNDGPQRGLGLKSLEEKELRALKSHIVKDFMKLHEQPVTFTILGVVALAILEPFASCTQRLSAWFVGLTGAGKSFLAKLAANFFGEFPVEDGTRFCSWSSTANYVERTGYWFRNAIYVADDYKPELVPGNQVVRVLQVYAEGSGRGRLQADARANVTRPIRGLLVCTGEDLPENNASVLARMVIVRVPNHPKDARRARRCLRFRTDYRGITADFIAWLIREDRLTEFASRVERHRSRFYDDIAGQQNDARIASNFALLAAAFEEFADYLGDDWPDREVAVRAFIEQDLPTIRDRMLDLTRGQQASEIFMTTLRELFHNGRVTFTKGPTNPERFDVAIVGKNPIEKPYYLLSIGLALGAVQNQLRHEGRQPLAISHGTLIEQLRVDGVILPPETPKAKGTQVRIGDQRCRCVCVPRNFLDPDSRV